MTQIYWEKQQDRMCGIHCINSLLQGPFHHEGTLSTIALELDSKQKQLMSEQGFTNDLYKYMKEESGNVALDGNYSIQVLAQGLKRIDQGMNIVSIEAILNKSDLSNETGFICNSSNHWLSIRKIDGVWYNLNSTNSRMPELISEFYLSAFLMSVKQNGYQIFVVRGNFPKTSPADFDHFNKNQLWISASRIKAYQQKRIKKSKNFKLNIGGTDEKEYEKAIKKSLGQSISSEEQVSEDEESQIPKKPEFQAYKGESYKISQQTWTNYPKFDMIDPVADPELFFSVRMSIEENLVFEPQKGIEVVFRLENGQKISRRFSLDNPIEYLYDFIFLKLTENEIGKKIKFYLSESFSKIKLVDVTLPIYSLGEEERVQLFVNSI